MKAVLAGFLNTGKTTLFNALCGTGIKTTPTGMPDADINEARMKVIDHRLYRLSEIFNPQKTTPATIEMWDIPGLEWGKEGESRFIKVLLDADVIVNVVRSFESENAPYMRDIDPQKDIVEFTDLLILNDMILIEKRIERINDQKKKGKKIDPLDLEMLTIMQDHLENGRRLVDLNLEDRFKDTLKKYQFLSIKPIIHVINIDEKDLPNTREIEDKIKKAIEINDSNLIVLCGRLESEIMELDQEERVEFMQELGIEESSSARLTKAIFDSLDLISFFTVGSDEVKAWPIKRGTNAKKAAGKIHSDLERGFIRAEVIGFEEFIKIGSLKEARQKGLLRLEGKDYIVQDGDILHIKFNV